MQQRKALPHEIPGWVSQGSRHFITINALDREKQPFMATARSENVALPMARGRAWVSDPSEARSENVALPMACSACPALPIACALLDSLLFYDSLGTWYLWLAVIMPDHIHFVATFNLEKGIESTIIAWKRYQAKTLGVAFQRDYFEHRLRDDDEFCEKAEYIRNNPVRRGLVDVPGTWPYLWQRF